MSLESQLDELIEGQTRGAVLLESILETLRELREAPPVAAPAPASIAPEPEPETPVAEPAKAAGKKKAASKKRAGKKASAPADDAPAYADDAAFRRAAAQVADGSGVSEPLAHLKAYIKAGGRGALVEVDVPERAAYLAALTKHFETLADAGEDTDDELAL